MGSASKKSHLMFGEVEEFDGDSFVGIRNHKGQYLAELAHSVPPWRKKRKEWTFVIDDLYFSVDCLEDILAKLKEMKGES